MKMSKPSWIERLTRILETKTTHQNRPSDTPRLAILGIGNELNADDGAGVLAARRVRAAVHDRQDVLVVEAGPSPENFTGPLRRFRPDVVIMIDAADMGEPPGSVRWIEWDAVDGVSASTHRLPPTTLASFLMSELGCEVVLLGIQPGDVSFDGPVSAEVTAAVNWVAGELTQLCR
jgi:hydrogenase 3 maturation protease